MDHVSLFILILVPAVSHAIEIIRNNSYAHFESELRYFCNVVSFLAFSLIICLPLQPTV